MGTYYEVYLISNIIISHVQVSCLLMQYFGYFWQNVCDISITLVLLGYHVKCVELSTCFGIVSHPSAKPQKLPVLLQYSAKQIIQSQIRIEFQFAGKTLQSPLCQYRAGFCSLWNRHSASLPCLGCGAQQYSRPLLFISSFYWCMQMFLC